MSRRHRRSGQRARARAAAKRTTADRAARHGMLATVYSVLGPTLDELGPDEIAVLTAPLPGTGVVQVDRVPLTPERVMLLRGAAAAPNTDEVLTSTRRDVVKVAIVGPRGGLTLALVLRDPSSMVSCSGGVA